MGVLIINVNYWRRPNNFNNFCLCNFLISVHWQNSRRKQKKNISSHSPLHRSPSQTSPYPEYFVHVLPRVPLIRYWSDEIDRPRLVSLVLKRFTWGKKGKPKTIQKKRESQLEVNHMSRLSSIMVRVRQSSRDHDSLRHQKNRRILQWSFRFGRFLNTSPIENSQNPESLISQTHAEFGWFVRHQLLADQKRR